MSDRIKAEDLFASDLFSGVNSGLEEYIKNLKEANTGMSDMIKSGRDLVNTLKFDSAASIEKLQKETEKLNVLLKQSTVLTSQQEIAQEKLNQQRLKTAAQQSKNDKQAAKDAEAIQKAEAKKSAEILKSQSAYNKLSKQLLDQKKAVKDLLAANKELSDKDKELIKNTQELDKRLKEIDTTVGDNGRRVGAYKEALNDAAAELGAFGGGLSRIIRTLKLLHEENEKATTGAQKMGNALKIIGAGLVLAVVALAAKVFESAKENVKSLADYWEEAALQATAAAAATYKFNSVLDARDAAAKYAKVLQASREALRGMALELQHVTFELEEQNQISNDSTIGYEERNKAVHESIRLSVEQAEKEKQIAALELNVANEAVRSAEVAAGVGEANNELKDRQLEAQKKYNETVAKGDLLTLQNAEKLRKIREEETLLSIDLLLKKKDSANADKAILEAELKDNKRQLEERKKVANELLAVNVKTTNEELRIFKKGIGIKFDSNKLVQEQDAVILAEKIKNLRTLAGHGLGEAATIELSKIIKTYQENQIANTKIQADLDEEAIKRKQKIADIEKEIGLIQKQLEIDIAAFNTEEQKKQYEEKPGIFSPANKTEENFKRIKKALGDETQLREQLLKAQAAKDIQSVKDSVNDEKIKAEEIKKINEKLFADLQRLSFNYSKQQSDLDEQRKRDVEERNKEIRDTVLGTTGEIIDKQNELQSQAIDQDLQRRENQITQQQSLAEHGFANQLAFEQAQLAKDELAKSELRKKEIREKKTLAFLKLISDDGFGKGSLEFALAEAVSNSFAEGVEDLDGPGTETSDSIFARLSKRESVITAAGTKANPGLPTAMNQGRVDEYFEKKYLPEYMTNMNIRGSGLAENLANSVMIHKLSAVENKLEGVIEAIKTRPVHQSEITKAGDVIETKISNGLKTVILHKTAKRAL